VDLIGDGFDNVLARGNYTLNAGAYVEILSTTSHGGTQSINRAGNSLNNVVIGNAGSNILDGGGGADRLQGLGGDDYLIVDSMDDFVDEPAGGGYDNLLCRADYVLTTDAEIEVISTDNHSGTASIDIRGSAFGQVIIGNAGDNILDGGGGADRLAGLGGNDFLIVDSMDDYVDETSGGGYDNLICRNSYVLTGNAEIEVISTDNHGGTQAIDITGSGFGQVIIGNAGSNILIGGGGSDRLAGLGGNDFLFVDSMDDFVDEEVNGGYDNLICRNSYVLTGSAEIEVISTDNHGGTAAIDITGSAYNQVIIGNAGNNVLDGSFGHDRLAGLGGADSYAFSTNLSNFNIDTIDGFDADDTILLENAIFTGLAAGGLNPNAFVNGTAAADADDRIIYDAATGRLFFDADGSGSGNMLHFATLENHFALTASDFTVI
jgi:Ca2+-binding RTX toxin-like protein